MRLDNTLGESPRWAGITLRVEGNLGIVDAVLETTRSLESKPSCVVTCRRRQNAATTRPMVAKYLKREKTMNNMRVALGLAIILITGSAHAGDGFNPTDTELKSLPAFCTWKLRGGRAEINQGFALLGEQFKNSIHYCAGLNFLNRYYRSPTSPGARSFLHFAIDEFTYMVEHLVPNSTLAAESYLGRATAYALSKRDAEAMRDFRQAAQHNPRLARVYVAWADFLTERKQQAEALKVVSEGLRWVPDSTALRTRYERLGGKLPYPEPVVAAETGKQENPDPPPAAKPEPAASEAKPAVPEPASPQAADPDRPYCRFCPDQP